MSSQAATADHGSDDSFPPGTPAPPGIEASGPLKLAGVATRPWRATALLMICDVVVLLLAGLISVQLRGLLGDVVRAEIYQSLWPLVFLFPVVFTAVGLYSGTALYPGAAISPADELRRATLSTTVVFLALAASTFLIRGGNEFHDATKYSRSIFLMWWAGSVVGVPMGRLLIRHRFARQPWWGHPVAVLGAGLTGKMVVEALQRHPELGLKPVAVVDDDPTKAGDCGGVPVVGPLSVVSELASVHRIRYAIVAMPGITDERLRQLYKLYGDAFAHLMIIPALVGFSSLWVSVRDLGGLMGLEVRQRLLLTGPRLAKRFLDLFLTIVGGAIVFPLVMVPIALLVKLSSPGPVFYGQRRLGRNNQPFTAWKFRSMRQDADQVLRAYLEKHPALLVQWESDHKLKNDPRVNAIGHFLRRTSLDELPQIWNVLRGEMSLVGPRPIVEAEIGKYDEHYSLYLKVRPGITGLWQISGRNDVDYRRRVQFDAYYVRNWSVWLDLYILMRTFGVVLFRRGAY